jgi:hypothetical protein
MTISSNFVYGGNLENVNAQPVYLVGTLGASGSYAGNGETTEAFVGHVGGSMTKAVTQFYRPTGTSAYIALDAVANATGSASLLTFSNIARTVNGSGYIVKAILMTDQISNTAKFRLQLYNFPPTPVADNDAFPLLWTNRNSKVGFLDFPAMFSCGSGSSSAISFLTPPNGYTPLAFICVSGSASLYGMLETLDAFTPAHNQAFHIELEADVN